MKTLALLIPIYFSTVFIVYINNNSISQCLRPRSLKVILQSSFFFTSISNPIENYLGSSVYLHKEARQYLIIRLGQSYVGNFPMPSSFTQIISLYYDLQNIIKSGCPLSLPLIPQQSPLAHSCQPQLFTSSLYAHQECSYLKDFAFAILSSSKLLAPYIHRANPLTFFKSFSNVTFLVGYYLTPYLKLAPSPI